MKVSYLLLISLLLVGALFVPAVSANDIIINENFVEYSDTSGTFTSTGGGYDDIIVPNTFRFRDISQHSIVTYMVLESSRSSIATGLIEGRNEGTYTLDGITKPAVIYLDVSRNFLGVKTNYKVTVFPDDWNVAGMSGGKGVQVFNPSGQVITLDGQYASGNTVTANQPFWFGPSSGNKLPTYGYKLTVASFKTWKNSLLVTTYAENSYKIDLTRVIDNYEYTSTLTLKNSNGDITYQDTQATDVILYGLQSEISSIEITSGLKTYTVPLSPSDDTPGDTPTMRTGSVTMTDHNGTTITGFEVTAVNHYTGEEYTIATDTDVVIMSLPMDRTTEIRNPQTGEYETAPIGYYRFYGQAPGYKMLFEDGIQVAVMPEKYGTYKLCDIGVTSDSGPLTGKHLFQIRSRSDNSILQTGTISAKSATTGEWYNTTVSGGLASLILPYDTSHPISEYAGNYYVYATSPGYEDSDYGTQITVMPHTVSEIKSILLTPIGGVPTPGNVTLRIQAMSETGAGVVNAEIFIAGVLGEGYSVWDTYTASSTGYLAVSVPGNSTYDIVASGAGFYDSARRIQVFTDDPDLIELTLYLSGYPTLEPTTEPTGWPTGPPATQPPGGIPDDDDDSDGFLVQAVRGIGLAFGVGFSMAKIIFGMLLALAIGFATAKQLRGGAAEFGMGLLGGTMLGVLIGLLPVWIIVVLLLVVGLYIGNRYVGGANNG